jgi:hypothetical protein
MAKQSRGVFFLVFGILFLGFIFSQRGQDMWNILTGRAISTKVDQTNQNGRTIFSANGVPLVKTPFGYVKPGETIPGTNIPYIPSVKDWGK